MATAAGRVHPLLCRGLGPALGAAGPVQGPGGLRLAPGGAGGHGGGASRRLRPSLARARTPTKSATCACGWRKPPRAGDLKRGPGGIVDIEFLVQMLQLQHARKNPRLRTPNTLAALAALHAAGLLDARGTRVLRRRLPAAADDRGPAAADELDRPRPPAARAGGADAQAGPLRYASSERPDGRTMRTRRGTSASGSTRRSTPRGSGAPCPSRSDHRRWCPATSWALAQFCATDSKNVGDSSVVVRCYFIMGYKLCPGIVGRKLVLLIDNTVARWMINYVSKTTPRPFQGGWPCLYDRLFFLRVPSITCARAPCQQSKPPNRKQGVR